MAKAKRELQKKPAKPSQKKVAKLRAAGGPVKKKAAARRKATAKAVPPGYRKEGSLVVPDKVPKKAVVAPSKMRKGLSKAKVEIQELMEELQDIASGFDLSEVELTVSFSADGKFLGVGVGGATSVTIRLRPAE